MGCDKLLSCVRLISRDGNPIIGSPVSQHFVFTVTKSTQGPPQSLSTAWQCGPAGSDGLITLGCITKDLSTTDGLSFIWKDSSNQEISTGVVQYPAVQESGGYSAVSQARVKASDWDAKKKFTCEVKNPKGTKIAELKKPEVLQQNAALLLTAPTQKELENGTATFVCLASDFSPKSHSFKWTQDGKAVSKVKDTIVSQSNKLYTAISVVQMPSGEWTGTVKCTFAQKDFTDSKEAVYGEPIDKTQVKVEITPPSTKDMLLLRSGKLVCSVNDITGLKGIKWLIGEKEIPSLPREILSKTAQITAKINFDEWRNGTKYTCEVEHSGFPQQFERKDFVRETEPLVTNGTITLSADTTGDNVKLFCWLDGFAPKNVHVTWYENGQELKNNPPKKTFQLSDKSSKVFSILSEISSSKEKWNKDTEFKCEVKHKSWKFESTLSMCKGYQTHKPLIRLEKPSLESILKKTPVIVSCVVETPLNAKVSWFKEGNLELKGATEKRMGEKIVSNLTINFEQWKELKTLTCKAVHKCFPDVELKINIKEPKKQSPTVVIRRNLADLEKENATVLECVGTDLPSGELEVTFQDNGRTTFGTQYFKLSENMDTYTARVSIENELQTKENTFTCEIQQSDSTKWTSNSTGKLFDDPSVELSAIHSKAGSTSQTQKLLCIGTGFNPKIKWVPASTGNVRTQVTMQADGRVQVFSENTVQQQEWSSGTDFKCEVSEQDSSTKAVKNISVCAAYSISKPLIRLEKPSIKSILKETPVIVSCVVETPLNAKVSWFKEENSELKGATEKRMGETIFSNLTINFEKWKHLKTLTCKAVHTCFTGVEIKINIKEPKKTSTTVVIRRNLADLEKGNAVVLECVGTDLPSGELEVTFKDNGGTTFGTQYFKMSENMDTYTARVSIENELQTKENTFTCEIQQSDSTKWTSKSTGKLFDDPSVELSAIHSTAESTSQTQKLLCIGTGFNPKIKWAPVSGGNVSSQVTMQADGRVQVFSENTVQQQEWSSGKDFKCEVSEQNSSTKAVKNISVCADFNRVLQVYLSANSIGNRKAKDDVSVTCRLLGLRLTEFTITWKEGKNDTPTDVKPQKIDVHRNGTESFDSVHNVPDAKWNIFETVFCEVMHPCFKSPETYNISKTKDTKIPTVRILSPSDQDLLEEHSASLVCFISGFYPADISVHWEQNGQQLDASRFTNSSVSGPSSSGSYFMYSALKLEGSERKKCTFSCVVRHESSEKRISDTIDNVYASVQRSDPSMDLLQDKNQLVCVVYDYSPSAINITWLLNSVTVGHMGSNITSAKRPDGKFIIKSHLKVHSSEWAPGHTYTCHVEHATGIKTLNITKTEFIEKMIYFDENKEDAITMDQAEETWNMACAFIILFIITLVYGCSVTLVKVKST